MAECLRAGDLWNLGSAPGPVDPQQQRAVRVHFRGSAVAIAPGSAPFRLSLAGILVPDQQALPEWQPCAAILRLSAMENP